MKHAWVAPAQGVLVVSGLMGLVYWSGLAPSSMQVGGVQGMLVTASLAGAILGRISLARGGWTFIGVLLVGYIALARVLGSGVVPPLAFTLVLSGIGSGTLGRILARKVRRGFIAGTVALTLTALPVAGGAWIGWRAYDAPEVEHDDSLDDDDSDGVYYTDDE